MTILKSRNKTDQKIQKTKARKKISPSLRKAVYEKYHGHCAYCGCKIRLQDMQVDHLYPVYLNAYRQDFSPSKESVDELNTITNLMPACRMCNFYKGTQTVDQFKKSLLSTLLPNAIRPFQFRLAEKYGLVEVHVHSIQFYFEKFLKGREKNEETD